MRRLMRLLRSLTSGRLRNAPDTPVHVRQKIAAARTTARPLLCNLGCGARHHPAWVNIDFHGDGETVLEWDLREGLPLPNRSCDAVYSSHVVEHFDRDTARGFLAECHRVLRSRGVLRLTTPDLEGIARTYLACLEAARRKDPGADDRYEWITIELLDQLVRHRSGGEMLKHWSRETVPEEGFVSSRVGTEYHRARAHHRGRTAPDHPLDAKELGLFRLGGEVHLWMYDSYSLGKLLADCGFVDLSTRGANESDIAGFSAYNLDTEPDGSVCKPDSFFIEARTP